MGNPKITKIIIPSGHPKKAATQKSNNPVLSKVAFDLDMSLRPGNMNSIRTGAARWCRFHEGATLEVGFNGTVSEGRVVIGTDQRLTPAFVAELASCIDGWIGNRYQVGYEPNYENFIIVDGNAEFSGIRTEPPGPKMPTSPGVISKDAAERARVARARLQGVRT